MMYPEKMVDLPERFAAMLRQESTAYRCEDYLSPNFRRKRSGELSEDSLRSSSGSAATVAPLSSESSGPSSSDCAACSSSQPAPAKRKLLVGGAAPSEGSASAAADAADVDAASESPVRSSPSAKKRKTVSPPPSTPPPPSAASASPSASDSSSAMESSSTPSSSSFSSSSTPSSSSPSCEEINEINEEWRSKMCDWTYQVIDHFDLNREVAAISLSYLDRYLSKTSVNKRTFQLVAMTTLYLACKLHTPRMIPASTLIELSRGYFTAEHIAAMEESVLDKLSWQVHPPTPVTFLRHLSLLLPPSSVSPEVWHDAMEAAKFLTELSVIDYFFVTQKPSSIAVAALLTVMEGIDEYVLSAQSRKDFVLSALEVAGVDATGEDVAECRNRLRTMYREGGAHEAVKEAEAAAYAKRRLDRDGERVAIVSPVHHHVATVPAVGVKHRAAAQEGTPPTPMRRLDESFELTSKSSAAGGPNLGAEMDGPRPQVIDAGVENFDLGRFP